MTEHAGRATAFQAGIAPSLFAGCERLEFGRGRRLALGLDRLRRAWRRIKTTGRTAGETTKAAAENPACGTALARLRLHVLINHRHKTQHGAGRHIAARGRFLRLQHPDLAGGGVQFQHHGLRLRLAGYLDLGGDQLIAARLREFYSRIKRHVGFAGVKTGLTIRPGLRRLRDADSRRRKRLGCRPWLRRQCLAECGDEKKCEDALSFHAAHSTRLGRAVNGLLQRGNLARQIAG